MADKTGIEWTHYDGQKGATWNPLIAFDKTTGKRGWFCIHASEGCRNCYAERINMRLGNGHAYRAPNLSKINFDVTAEDLPRRWQRPRLIFVNSMTDLFLPAVHDDLVERIYRGMIAAPWHIFLILTKHPGRMLDLTRKFSTRGRLGELPKNIWHGFSAEDQPTFDRRWELARQVPSDVIFVSLEPMLGEIDLQLSRFSHRLNWVIAGGESGNQARPMNPKWPRRIRDDCRRWKVPFFFKQWGEFLALEAGEPYCESCGCTEERACPGGCHWVADERMPMRDVCSQCVGSKRQILAYGSDELTYIRVGKKEAGAALDKSYYHEYPPQVAHIGSRRMDKARPVAS